MNTLWWIIYPSALSSVILITFQIVFWKWYSPSSETNGLRDLKCRSGISLCTHPANERWCYNVTSSLISLAHSQNDPCKYVNTPSMTCRNLTNDTSQGSVLPHYTCNRVWQKSRVSWLCLWTDVDVACSVSDHHRTHLHGYWFMGI